MSDSLFQKVISTATVGSGGGGLMNPDQANKFIDYMWDETALIPQIRQERMNSDTKDIDKLNIGRRISRLATEAVDDGVNAGAAFTKISLTTKKIRLDFEISKESLEDNIEGADLEDHLARLMATQFGNDLEDLAINGDASSSDPLLKAFDGYSKILRTKAISYDAEGTALNRQLLNDALKLMPRKVMAKRKDLKFFAGSNAIQDYIFSFQQVENGFVSPEAIAAAGINRAVRPNGPAGFTTAEAFGNTIQEIPLFNEFRKRDDTSGTENHGEFWLTYPKNLILGVKREVEVHREFKPKKDTIEYTVYTRIGVQVEDENAAVVVYNTSTELVGN